MHVTQKVINAAEGENGDCRGDRGGQGDAEGVGVEGPINGRGKECRGDGIIKEKVKEKSWGREKRRGERDKRRIRGKLR